MRWTSIIAIYTLFWVLSAFLVLPFGVRTRNELPNGEAGDLVPGQVESAPVNFRPGRVAKITTVVSLVLFGLFYLNYVNGWLTSDMFDASGGAPDLYGEGQRKD
jgi:predicted secreted protein